MLGQDERPVAGDVLQTAEIAAKGFLVVQVHVEGDEVDLGEVEVFRRREVGVADQRLGSDRLHLGAELVEERLDALFPVPAHDVGRNLVADHVREHGAMARRVAHSPTNRVADLGDDARRVEERDVLRPRNPDQDA